MIIKDMYNQLSAEIMELNFNSSTPNFLTENSAENLNIYKENLLSGAIEKISEAYPATFIYLEENNFNYFVRLYLTKKSITSFNIDDFLRGFVTFFIDHFEIHQDEVASFLVQVDYMWNFGDYYLEKDHYPSGLIEYWMAIIQGHNLDIEIDLTLLQKVDIIERNGERCFSIALRPMEAL
jgi:hypothetical protein